MFESSNTVSAKCSKDRRGRILCSVLAFFSGAERTARLFARRRGCSLKYLASFRRSVTLKFDIG